MVTYLKTSQDFTMFYDPSSGLKILPKQIVAFEGSLNSIVRERIRKKGLIECTEEQYNAQFPPKKKDAEPEVEEEKSSKQGEVEQEKIRTTEEESSKSDEPKFDDSRRPVSRSRR